MYNLSNKQVFYSGIVFVVFANPDNREWQVVKKQIVNVIILSDLGADLLSSWRTGKSKRHVTDEQLLRAQISQASA